MDKLKICPTFLKDVFMSAPQTTRVQCPQCRQPVTVNVMSVVDVGQQPQLKAAVLRGQINAVACPSCGYRGLMAMPMLYHDPAKQLALVVMPTELNLRREDEERTIGKLTNALLATIPNEQRKMYMLQPRMVLSQQRLIEEIYQADGVTKEELDKQAAQQRLLQTLLRSANNTESLKQAIQANKADITQEFIDLVANVAMTTLAEGNQPAGAQLMSFARLVASELGLNAPGQRVVTVDELIEAFRQTKDAHEFRELVAATHSALDYKFYQALTAKIEQAMGDEANALKQLRSRLLSVSEELEKEAERAYQQGNQLLQEILQSRDYKQALAANAERIDDSFLMALQIELQRATQMRQESVVRTLKDVYQEVVAQMENRMPPEMQFVNQLLRAPAAERAALLQANAQLVTTDTLQLMASLVQDWQAQGRMDAANELVGVMEQAAQLVEQAHLAAMNQLRATLPSNQQIIVDLLQAEPSERAEILRTHLDMVTPELIEAMTKLANDFHAQGRTELARELADVVQQTAAWLTPVSESAKLRRTATVS
jgi:hypothetical protein